MTNAVLPLLAKKGVGLVQFDAHADLRDSYEGSKYSHACVMKRAVDLGISIAQIGIRSLSPQENACRENLRIPHWDAIDLQRNGMCCWELPEDFPEKIYVTFDVDALDPSIMPATGTPEPGGMGWYDALKALKNLSQTREIIGFDLVELAPIPSLHFPDYTCARLIYSFMAYLQR